LGSDFDLWKGEREVFGSEVGPVEGCWGVDLAGMSGILLLLKTKNKER